MGVFADKEYDKIFDSIIEFANYYMSEFDDYVKNELGIEYYGRYVDIVTSNIELARKVKDIAQNYKTLYVMGCFGAPMTEANKKRYCANHNYNKNPERQKMIKAATSDTFGFDCVCLIKGVLWGWNGNKNKTYGGAIYFYHPSHSNIYNLHVG